MKNETNLAIADLRKLFGGMRAQICAIKKYFATCRLVESSNDVEQSAFAGTGRSDNRNRFSCGNLKGDIVEHADGFGTFRSLIALGDFDNFQQNVFNRHPEK